MKLTIPAGLLTRDIDAHTYAGAARKVAFHREGRAFLKALAGALGLSKGSYEVRSHEGGIAVSGEVTLHGESLYVQLCESALGPGVSVMYRRCRGRRDYCGEANHFVHAAALTGPERLDRFVTELKVLGGLMGELRRAA